MIPVTKHISSNVVKTNRLHTTLNRLFTTSTTSLVEISNTGSCGIPKYDMDKINEKEKKEKEPPQKMTLPAHLIRPVCLTGGAKGGFQTCVADISAGGLYCLTERHKYKYGCFSDNIDFVLPKDNSKCWWHGGDFCLIADYESIISSLTRPIQMEHHNSKKC